MPNPELQENDPALAEVVDQLESMFHRSYNLSEMADAATLAEGLHQLGMHLAQNSQVANVSIGVGANGITSVSVTATPKQ